jgi:hypothetical protein
MQEAPAFDQARMMTGDRPNYLVVNVLDGRDLGINLAKPPNPMVEVTCEGQVIRSESRSRTNEPVWREELELAVSDPAQTLTVKVYHQSKSLLPWKKGIQLLGQYRFSLFELKEEEDPK